MTCSVWLPVDGKVYLPVPSGYSCFIRNLLLKILLMRIFGHNMEQSWIAVLSNSLSILGVLSGLVRIASLASNYRLSPLCGFDP